MGHRFVRFLAAVLLLAPVMSLGASAQSDTGEIDIVVRDTTSKAPLAMARVLLDGPVIASEFTGQNGKVRFTDVPDGIYRARVFARGYSGVTSQNFEVTNERVVTITVALAKSNSSRLKTIATVIATSTATIATTTIDANSAQRKLSDDLAGALGKLSGVTVATSSSNSDATQTVSLDGQDAGQTALTLDGIPLNAPGTAGDLRALGSDLFTRSAVSFGPQVGGLAGGVNFGTLEPTLSWQGQFLLSAGSDGKNNYALGESGSIGKLGFAAMRTYRSSPSLLDGMRFLDTSGLDYTHEGDGQQNGSLFKMRYQMSGSQTLAGMYLHSANGAELVCAQITGPLPCGYGPNNTFDHSFDLYSLSDDALVGDTQVQASFYGTRNGSRRDELSRYVNGVAEPTGTAQSMDSNGFTLNAMLPAKQHHTIAISAYATHSKSDFTPLVPEAKPYVYAGQSTGYGAITIDDTIRSNTRLRFTGSLGLSHASNAGATALVGIGTQWAPTTSDSFAFSYNVGGAAPHAGRSGILSDPAQLRFDCSGEVAYGNAPGAVPGASSSTSARFSYTHHGRHGLTSLSLYRQSQNGIVLPTQVNGAVLQGFTPFPSGYFGSIAGNFDSACGQPAGTPFGPQNVYFSIPIAGVQRVYQGAQISGYYTLGHLVVEPYYDIQSAVANGGGALLDNPYSITIPGAQLPNVPLHREGITLDYKAPHSAVEWLADASHVGANNWQNLPAYTTVDAGVSTSLQRGSLVLAMSNVFNQYGGVFASSQWAVPYRTPSGLLIPTIARPNQPRQISLTYSVRFGQNVLPAPARALSQGGGRGRFRRFFQPLPQSAPADPFALVQSPRCASASQATAKPILAGLKKYVAQIEAAKASGVYPASMPSAVIPGVTVAYHGMKTTYALTMTLSAISEIRALFGCSSLHFTTAQTAQQRALFIPPTQGGGPFFQPSVAFMPNVGLYFVRQAPRAGTENFRVYRLPVTPPKAPFALRTASQNLHLAHATRSGQRPCCARGALYQRRARARLDDRAARCCIGNLVCSRLRHH